jgi:hypothetical protein
MAANGDRRLGDMLDYLPADEQIVGKHKIGSFDIVTTTERVIILKKFPRMFIEVHYAEINNLEHRTNILWNELVSSIALLALAVVLYVNNVGTRLTEPLNNLIMRFTPDFALMLPADYILPILIILSAAVGAYHLHKFIPSVNGYFRISRRERAPVVIPTGMSSELKMLIKEIEELVRQKAVAAMAPAASLGGMVHEAPNARDEIREKLLAELREVADNKVILISSKSENHTPVVSGMLDFLIRQREMGGVYLSVTRPYEYIITTMNSANIPSDNIFFIDCISMMAGKSTHEKRENVVFVENPSSLEEVSMYLDKMLAKVTRPRKFLFLDSLSSLLIYNNDKSVKEFTHFIINKIRLENIAGIILSIEKKEAEDLVKTLTPMCDAELRF